MLDEQLKTQLAAYLERVQQPFELVASLDDSETARDMRELLTTIQSLRSDKITLRTDGNDARKPSFSLQRVGATNSLRFAPRWSTFVRPALARRAPSHLLAAFLGL